MNTNSKSLVHSTVKSYDAHRKEWDFMPCAGNEGPDQPAHSRSLIRIFAARILDSQGRKVS